MKKINISKLKTMSVKNYIKFKKVMKRKIKKIVFKLVVYSTLMSLSINLNFKTTNIQINQRIEINNYFYS